MNGIDQPRLLWGITSSGCMLGETLDLMIEVLSWNRWVVEVMLTRETPFVLKYYGLWQRLRDHFAIIHEEQGSNTPFLGGPIQKNRYAFLIIAPVTGNTMAKIAHGIADALIPNCVALGLKAAVEVGLFPTDQERIGEQVILKDGSTLQLYPRPVDLDNVRKVKEMPHVTVFKTLDEMHAFLVKKRGETIKS
nr:flavoprotein [Candidatus Sigynarchaeota archaeon]